MEDKYKELFSYEKRIYQLYIRISTLFFILGVLLGFVLLLLLIYTFPFEKYPEYNVKDRDFTVLKSFNFNQNSETIKYSPNISNLGNTSELEFSCYTGNCQKIYYDDYNYDDYHINNYKFINSKIKNVINNNKNEKITKKLKSFYYDNDDDYYNYIDSSCSEECAIKKSQFCNACLNNNEYVETTGKCVYLSKDEFESRKYCFASHLILKWKGYLYTSKNIETSYLSSVILPNEDCPQDKQLCGIIDDKGNKLCLSKGETCPINKIVISDQKPDDGYIYNKIILGDKTIYYTNNDKNGRIVESLYVDSDHWIQYERGCQLIDIGTIEELINDNKDVYKSSNIDLSARSYLKYCDILHGKMFDFESIKDQINRNKDIKDMNKNIINTIQMNSISICIIGLFSLFCFLILILNKLVNYYWDKREDRDPYSCKFLSVSLLVIIFVLLICSLISIHFDTILLENKTKAKKYEEYLNFSAYNVLTGINKAFYIMSFISIGIFVICSLYYTFRYFKKD